MFIRFVTAVKLFHVIRTCENKYGAEFLKFKNTDSLIHILEKKNFAFSTIQIKIFTVLFQEDDCLHEKFITK